MTIRRIGTMSKFIYISIILIMLNSMILPSFAASEIERPVIESIQVGSEEVSGGEEVTFSVKVTDQLANINGVSLSFLAPSGNKEEEFLLQLNESKGLWEGTYKVKPTDEAGWWKFYNVYVTDQENHNIAYHYDEIDLGKEIGFTVKNNNNAQAEAKVTDDFSGVEVVNAGLSNADVTKPTLNSITVEPKEVTVGDTVKISVDAEDKESGIYSVYATYEMPITEKLHSTRLTFNTETQKYEGTINITDEIENGTWQISTLSVADNADNVLKKYNKNVWKYESTAVDLSLGDFIVNGATGSDVTKPTLNSITVEPKEVTVGDTVTISVDAEDKESGIYSVYATYEMPITEKLHSTRLEFNTETQKYEGTIEITNEIENGTWQISTLSVADNADNVLKKYNKSVWKYESTAVDLSVGDFTVSGATGADVTKPTLNSITVEPKEVTVGDTVAISVDAEDKESGIYSVYATYEMPITEKLHSTRLKFNTETQKYEGTIEITNEIEKGTWQISTLSVADNAENVLKKYNNNVWKYEPTAVDLSSVDFTVFEDPNPIKPLDETVVTENETWTNKTVNGDVYIGPNAVLTVNGDVTIHGNVYVLGAFVSYGTLNINGTIHANNLNWGWSTLYNGTVNFRAGTNNFNRLVASSRPLDDIPLEIYTNPIIAENGIIKNIEGATLPIADMYVNGTITELRWNGTFILKDLNVGNNDTITFTFVDVFGNTITNQFPLEIIDTISPTATLSTPGGYYGSPKSVSINMSEAGTIYYTLDGETPSVTSSSYNEPIKIREDTTLSFIAVDKHGNQSQLYSEIYKFFNVNEVNDQSKGITGFAQPNSTIIAKTDNAEWTVITDDSGLFDIRIPLLSAGTIITTQAIDENGMESELIELTVIDVTAPPKPEVFEVTDQSKQVNGKAEKGTTIEVKANGSIIGTSKAKLDGTFSVIIPIQKAETTLTVTASDEAGNKSDETIIKVKDVTAPAKPEVHEVTDQSKQVNGKAEKGTTIEVKVNDAIIGTSTAKTDGTFSVTIPVQKSGTTLSVTSADKAGNKSEEVVVEVKDITPPAKPEVNEVTDQSKQVTGKAEKGTTIEVKANGAIVGTSTVKSDGAFSVTIPVQKGETSLTVTATDKAGNRSGKTNVVVKDVTAPTKPVVNKVTNLSQQVSGKAEVGTILTVKMDKLVIGTGTVDANGTFKVEIPLQAAGTSLAVISTDKAGNQSEIATVQVQIGHPSVKYATHVQDYGWQDPVLDGEMSGTAGKAKRLEGITIEIDKSPYQGGISYRTHVQDYGWQGFVSNGIVSGTEGKAKRLEAIQIKLTGEMAEHYDVYYRVHAQTFGWLGWARNGQSAGTEGLSKRLEGIEIVLVPKGGVAPGSTDKPFLKKPSVSYTTHVQDYGWMNFVEDGALSGTQKKGKRLEAIKINLNNTSFNGDIIYTTHVQDHGWLPKVTNGAMSGTSGEGKRLEAITINLTGDVANYYDVYYRVHIQDYGWLGWAKNGMNAGSAGQAKRLEAIEINLVPKGQGQAVNQNRAFLKF